MDPLAVEHARGRLRKAEKAVEALKAADNYESAEDAWSDFLMASSAIYSKLEQGAKGAKSAPWYGRKKHERRTDPLLNYLHIARNSDEHGIDRVAARGGNLHDIVGGAGEKLKFNERRPYRIETVRDGKTGEVKLSDIPTYLYGPSLQMVTVHDRRTGVSREPPTQHLGQPIHLDDLWLTGVAELGLAYFHRLVAEAEQQTTRPENGASL